MGDKKYFLTITNEMCIMRIIAFINKRMLFNAVRTTKKNESFFNISDYESIKNIIQNIGDILRLLQNYNIILYNYILNLI